MLIRLAKMLKALHRGQTGVTAIEYGLIAALIAVAIIGGVTAVSSSLNQTFNTVSSKLNSASASQ